MSSTFVRANGAVHHVHQDGRADLPPLVIANSLGTDLRIWDGVVSALGSTARIVRYDMRGHGLTEIGSALYTIPELARDLEAILDALDVREAVVCGISVGGLVAMQLADTRRDLVHGLALCDTGYRIGAAEMWNQRIAAVNDRGIAAISAAVIERWFSQKFRDREPNAVAGYRCMLERTTAEGYAGVCAAIRDADLELVACRIECPTLVVCGEEDRATPPAAHRALAKAIAGARLELVRGAGHLPCVEQPAVVATHVDAFLRSHAYV